MSTHSKSPIRRGLVVDIFYEGVLVGRGSIQSIDATRASVTIRDFPLGTDSFLGLSIHCEDGRTVNVPVRVVDNTGAELEVWIECREPEVLTAALRGDN